MNEISDIANYKTLTFLQGLEETSNEALKVRLC